CVLFSLCLLFYCFSFFFFFFSSRRRHTRSDRDWSSDVCSSDLLFGSAPAWRVSRIDPNTALRGASTAWGRGRLALRDLLVVVQVDRKSTRLNSSHDQSSYAVFCLK